MREPPTRSGLRTTRPDFLQRFPAWDLTPEGACTACGTKCAGVFEARPGTWGQRRMPVRLAGEPTLRRARV
jgi:hypothetical protein